MNEYELLYIIHPRLTQDEAAQVSERVNTSIANRGGEVLTTEIWGRRRLAYPIQHQLEGTYVLVTMRIEGEAANALEGELRLAEDIMRHMMVRGIIPKRERPDRDRSRYDRDRPGDRRDDDDRGRDDDEDADTSDGGDDRDDE